MREICIPLPDLNVGEQADVVVYLRGNKTEFHYRVESIPWEFYSDDLKNSNKKVKLQEQIKNLKKTILDYDKNWELVQIFEPSHKSQYIQVLYKKKP